MAFHQCEQFMRSQTAPLSEYLVTFWARIRLFTKCKNEAHLQCGSLWVFSNLSWVRMPYHIFTFSEKSYPCSKCDKVFWQRGSLRMHELFILVKSHIEWECLITFLHLVKNHILAQNVTWYSDNGALWEHMNCSLWWRATLSENAL